MMPNFHKNNLVIVADEPAMMKVLKTFESNLQRCAAQTGFQGRIEPGDSINAAYSVVERYIDSWYQFAFCPNPTGVSDSQESRSFDLGGFFASFAMAARGRAISDSASVRFGNYSNLYGLTVSYDTAWEPNSGDLDYFFEHLSVGLYGVAYYHADEGDGYESIGTISGVHRGRAPLFEESPLSSSWTNAHSLKRAHQDAQYADLYSIDDVGTLAETLIVQSWDEFGWEEDEFGNNEIWGTPSINWRKPTDNDFTRIDSIVLEVLSAFPQEHSMNRYSMEEYADNAETLNVGERVVVRTVWDDEKMPSEYEYRPRYVMFNVETMSGKPLDRLHDWMEIVDDWRISEAAPQVLACLLPHVNATICELNPVSLRNANVTSPEMSIRFDLEPIDLDAVILEVHEALEKSFEDRSLSTIGREDD